MLQRPNIYHLKALNVDNIILEGQSCSYIRDMAISLFVKSVLFGKKGMASPSMLPRPCPSKILLSITKAFKMTYCGSLYHL